MTWGTLMWAALVALVAATAGQRLQVTRTRDPTEQCPTCRPGEACHIIDVQCAAPPCAKIAECGPVDCNLSCKPGFECRRLVTACGQQLCPILPPRCLSKPASCEGRCQLDETCLITLEPCRDPPCREQAQCVARPGVYSSRGVKPPPPPNCPPDITCGRGYVCVYTRVCRRIGDCTFQASCLPEPQQPDCLSHRCEAGERCEMQEAQCGASFCGLKPVCVVDADTTLPPTPTANTPPNFDLGNRFGGPPKCVTKCSAGEECQLAPGNCASPPCKHVPRCISRGQPPPSELGTCPFDDLHEHADPAFCDAANRFNRCGSDAECGGEKRCCQRGCGTLCLPVCRNGCGPRQKCHLVRVQCLGSPCPKVPQCVEADVLDPVEGTTTTTPRPAPTTSRPAFKPRPTSGFGGGGAGNSFRPDQSGSRLPQPPPSSNICDGVRCRPDQVCLPKPCLVSQGCKRGSPPPRSCQFPPRTKPGSCPANEQAPSVICFDTGLEDLCYSDADCGGSERCCLSGCQKICRQVCPSCTLNEQCRMPKLRREPQCAPLSRRVRG